MPDPDAAMPHSSIELIPDACTACMICVRECPAWCIELESHPVEIHEPGARRAKTVHALDQFTIDYGSCLYCGICIEVCPFDALTWSADATPAAPQRVELVRGIEALRGSTSGK